MPQKRKKEPAAAHRVQQEALFENAGVVVEQPIIDTLEKNFMPYAMSIILSRAIPEIDGFKPSHRKLLYTMYKMGLLNGGRTKSANVVGQTMKLNPHGDGAIYETMVRLSRGYEALLHPYVDSKGNFGKAYSRDMAYAASRYTEVKLDAVSVELFRDIDKDTVDFVDNYDSTMKEPSLLPVTFPTILTNSNVGIAVGMASSFCSFNLAELCEATIALLKNPQAELEDILKAPDFPGGGYLLYNRGEIDKVYRTGRGSFRVRCRYQFDKANNCVEIIEIPPTTTVEAIMDKVVELVKGGRIREISDMRDETDLSGLKLTIDLKRGADPDKLMQKLCRLTPLEDAFSCNFNVLIGGTPKVLGVYELLNEWIAFRQESVRRRVYFDLNRMSEKLHLLKGLEKILLDIDKAVRIVRETEQEEDVVPNLMIGFGIDEVQAEYVAEIRLRHLNREYILKRTAEISELEGQIAKLQEILGDPKKIREIIAKELRDVAKKYGKPRKTLILYADQQQEEEPEEEVPDYPVRLFFTKEGYFKKITPLSLRLSGEHKLKEGDEILQDVESSNAAELLFFTNMFQVYKCRACEFDDTKASVMGDYLAARLGMDEGEVPVYMAATKEYNGFMFFAFQNGKAAKIDMSAYMTKTRRKKLTGAYSDKSPLVSAVYLTEDRDMVFYSAGRVMVVHSSLVTTKSTRDSQGLQVIQLKKNARLERAVPLEEGMFENPQKYRPKNIPSMGSFVKQEDFGEQMTLS
ncbi:MAG: topoisomerase IV [Oscillospiraceae bacterium]|jgi:DNA gyrase subunit A|nr:topoisomerase IV [Oscillospiraceae bacterium]